MAGVRTEEVKLTVDGKEMPAFLALPEAAGARPAVLVFEEVFGVNVHIRDVSERLAREGYVAIAPDYHHRAWTPGTQLGYTDEDMKKGMALIPKLTAEGLLADMGATIAYLKTRKEVDAAKLGAIGFCIGGHIAYLAAATQPITVTASFYGGGIATFGPGGAKKTVERTGGSCASSARRIR
jgi:carboxymethylenebutenolidase